MADNVLITAGTDTTISTEEVTTLNAATVTAQQVQRVAAAIRTADSTAIDLGGDATYGLDVDVTRIAAGDNNIGNVDVASIAAGTNNIGVITPYALPAAIVQGSTAKIEDTNATAIIAADATLRIYLTSVIVTNSDATVGTLVTIQDSADTPVVLCKGYAAAAGGGFALTFPVPPRTTAAKALNAICTTTSAEVYVSAVGFLAA